MLVELSIRDLVLIEAAELRFGPGLNVITGETGAGKSLLVGALELLLGETPKGGAGGWVRKGADEAHVEGRVVLREAAAAQRVERWLEAELPRIAEDFRASAADGEAELVLGRSLTREGRTRAHVNQRPVPRKALRALAGELFEIHGQNDHQRLFEPDEQCALLDARGKLSKTRADYGSARAAWLALAERARKLEAERAERRDRLELYRFQLGELSDARLTPGEHASLGAERRLLRAAGEMRGELDRLVHDLAEADGAVLERLRGAERTLERWSEDARPIGAAIEELRGALVHVEEAAAGLTSFKEGVEDDPLRLDAVEERLAELERLETKHATDAEGLLRRRDELTAEIERLEQAEESLTTVADDLAATEAEVAKTAAVLTKRRRALAPKVGRAVEGALAALGLERARLEVAIVPLADKDAPAEQRFGPRGAEAVELRLAANPGEDARPLRHVASGGEAARIMLALRTALRTGDQGRTLVFDEIDAGVGGRLGPEVGRHLRTLAEEAQVLCVTHLPAIAAHAHVHLRAAKEVKRNRTRTRVAVLEGESRVREVAAMIAGGADEATARAEATRLLAEAEA
ncbi:MAG: DNA repair protein RecN [Planctomycetota bacterium]